MLNESPEVRREPGNAQPVSRKACELKLSHRQVDRNQQQLPFTTILVAMQLSGIDLQDNTGRQRIFMIIHPGQSGPREDVEQVTVAVAVRPENAPRLEFGQHHLYGKVQQDLAADTARQARANRLPGLLRGFNQFCHKDPSWAATT